jgi:hypothetical protein
MGVRANVAFHTQHPPYPLDHLPGPEQVVIRFEGRELVWHPNLEPDPDGQHWWPGLTVVVNDPDDYAAEAELLHRFLSALTFQLKRPFEVVISGGSGTADPLAPPVPRALRRGLGDLVTDAPAEVEVEDDERLRLVLALYREGLTSESPFYRFLSLWNALDAVFNNNVDAMTEFVNAHAPSLAAGREGYDPPPDNWASYLYDSNRNAIAHAVRRPGSPVLDPDAPGDRARLHRDSRLVGDLVRGAVSEQWGRPVRFVRRDA